jgi:hypothetical protein
VPIGYHTVAAILSTTEATSNPSAPANAPACFSGVSPYPGVDLPGELTRHGVNGRQGDPGAILTEARAEVSSPRLAPPCSRDLMPLQNKSEGQSTCENRAQRRAMVAIRTILNRETGEVVDVDPRISRIRHLRRRIGAWAQTVSMLNVQGRLVMIGLTYADGSSWRSDDISDYMNRLSHYLGSDLLAYSWVAELQGEGNDGAIHYHVLCMVKRGTDVPKPDESGMWIHGSSSRKSAWSAWYLMTYAKKPQQKGLGEFAYPPGARITGASWRHIRLIAEELGSAAVRAAHVVAKISTLPRWLLTIISGDTEAVLTASRHVGGGYSVGDTLYKSPWSLMSLSYVQA